MSDTYNCPPVCKKCGVCHRGECHPKKSELAAMPGSLLVDCTEDTEEFRARKPHNRIRVWKGRDFWHQKLSVQVRLEPDGSIYLSTQEDGRVDTHRSATITVEQLHAAIRAITANKEITD